MKQETVINNDNTITLDTPIKRGDQTIGFIELRKPMAGELRGLSLSDLLQMDVSALQRVIPRISNPMLTEADMAGMDPADLMQCGAKVAGFLLPKGALVSESLKQ